MKTDNKNAKLVQNCFWRYLSNERKPPSGVSKRRQRGIGLPFPKYKSENDCYEMMPDGNVKPLHACESYEEAYKEEIRLRNEYKSQKQNQKKKVRNK